MTEDDIKAIEERVKAATPGPWIHCGQPNHFGVCNLDSKIIVYAHERNNQKDCEFIRCAREDIPKLLSALRESQKREGKLRDTLCICKSVISSREPMSGILLKEINEAISDPEDLALIKMAEEVKNEPEVDFFEAIKDVSEKGSE